MYKNPIKLKLFFNFLLLSISFTPTVTGAEVDKAINLSQNIKNILIKSNPILGRNVTKVTFSGKPILISFFASW